MEHRQLGRSGLKVPVLSLGTGTFGGRGDFFKAWGDTDAKGAAHLVDVCLDAGLTLFDSADIYSNGMAEEILGAGDQGPSRQSPHLDQGDLPVRAKGPNDGGLLEVPPHPRASRGASVKRLGTDTHRPLPAPRLRRDDADRGDAVGTLDDLVRAGKMPLHRLLEFLGLAPDEVAGRLADRNTACPRYVAHQAYYSLIGRDYEWELMPLGPGPEGSARWPGAPSAGAASRARSAEVSRCRRPAGSRASSVSGHAARGFPTSIVYNVVDALDEVAKPRSASRSRRSR